MVESTDFSVIQGGDYTAGDGSGGESATGTNVPDELWEVKPEFEINSTDGSKGALKNEPRFRDQSLYENYDKDTGVVTYRKGLILMAKTSAPDSAGSQFFITLDKTVLPAEYTVFGVVQEASFSVLDKIKNEVDPINAETNELAPADYKDGKPNKDLIIEKITLI